MDFKIETIDHYTRNNDMKLIKGEPPGLECQSEKIKKINPPISLTTHPYTDSGKVEKHMESLLHYMHEKRQQPNFVTTRQLMTTVACGILKELFIIPFKGIVFLLPKEIKWLDVECSKKWKPSTSATTSSSTDWEKAYQCGGNFQHFMTKDKDEPISTERNGFKAVMKATIDGHVVLYSAEVDAMDAQYEHYELKSISGGIRNDTGFSKNSQKYYWQAYFANVNTILVGARTDEKGKDPKTGYPLQWPEYSLYEVQKVSREDIPGKEYLETKPERPNSWNVETGKNNIRKFFKLVEEECSQKVCYVATSKKSGEDVEWTFERADENEEDKNEVQAFRATLQEILVNEEDLDEAYYEGSNDDFWEDYYRKSMKNPEPKITVRMKPMKGAKMSNDDYDEGYIESKKTLHQQSRKYKKKIGNKPDYITDNRRRRSKESKHLWPDKSDYFNF